MFGAFFRANNFPWETFKKYWANASRSELIMDIFGPLLISLLLGYYAYAFGIKFEAFIKLFQQVSGQVIAAVSILAGFNVASITILASVNNPSINALRTTPNSSNTMSLFAMLISFFTWAVIIQLIVLLLSVVLFYIGSLYPESFKDWGVPWWAWVFAILWLTLTLHSIFLSIRNMKTLYLSVIR